MKYQADFTARKDHNEFLAWYAGELQKAGVTHEQFAAGLENRVKQNGNNYGIIPPIIEGLYRQFQSEKAARIPRTKPAFGARIAGNPGGMRRYPKTAASQTTIPPVLESTQGNNYAGRPSIRAEAFADMTSDEQADALMQLGLV